MPGSSSVFSDDTMGMCMGGGFRSYAPAPMPQGCAPGFIPPGCKGSREVLAAASSAARVIDPFQVTRVLAIVDSGSAATLTIDDLQVDGQPLFPRTQTATGSGGLGLVAQLTPALYQAGANPLPPMPNIDNNHPLVLVEAGGAIVVRYRLYFGNPAEA